MRLLPLLTFTLSAFPYYAYSYCVYNKHSDDTDMMVSQVHTRPGFSGFRKDIPPGGHECCPYNNSDCNPYVEDPNATVRLSIIRHHAYKIYVQFTVTVPAGGWVVVDGDKENHTVAVKWADGRNYDETKIEYGGS
ncbi:hypothetical protein BJV82DRAFT_683025 [Fennellomyces sp. T-0311]|nr:hypothetical protein BJV82DRAFT_683025 [Fennellomyces sp. T-0311]